MSSSSTVLIPNSFRTIEVEVQRLHWYVDPIGEISVTPILVQDKTYLKDPSLNLLPQFHGIMVPSRVFCIRTTGFKIPGTAADASSALQMTVSGAVM